MEPAIAAAVTAVISAVGTVIAEWVQDRAAFLRRTRVRDQGKASELARDKAPSS